jgi:hypothetical protein
MIISHPFTLLYLFHFHFEMNTPYLVSQHNFAQSKGKKLSSLCFTCMKGIKNQSQIMPYSQCCNPSLGLVTKARCGKVVNQEGDLGVTSHVPRSAKSVRE